MTTPISALPELTSAQTNKFETYNSNLRKMEALSYRVIDDNAGAVPGAPSDGDTYIEDVVSGAWTTLNAIAHYSAGAWYEYAPFEGLTLWVNDINKLKTYNGSAWVDTVAASLGITGMTDGSIPFVASGALAEDNANLFWDDANNRLGIGNNAPAHPLDVTGNIRYSSQLISTVTTGTAPMTVASTTVVTNLNADQLDGADWASPAALGSVTPAAVSATDLTATGTINLCNATTNPNLNVLGTGTSTFSGDVVVTGNLTVNGTTTTVNSTNMEVDDALISLASGNTGTTLDIGIIGERDSGNNTAWFFDESDDTWHSVFTTSTASSTTVSIGSYAPIHVGEFTAVGITGLTEGGTRPAAIITATSSETVTGNTFPHLVLINTDATNGNHIKVGFTDESSGGGLAAAMDVVITDHGNNYGTYSFWTRGTDGFLSRIMIGTTGDVDIETGDLDLVTASASYRHDGVALSSLIWTSATVPASTLDGAGTVTLQGAGGSQQFKLRELRLVGGGTNYGAGGDRDISISDGTTTWSTIPNATIEALPAATKSWGDTELPFNAGTADTASAAGTAITVQYSGGTTDHGGVGSFVLVACLEKVA